MSPAVAESQPTESLSRELQEELFEHAGEWVATTGDELIAFGDDATVVYKEACAAGVEAPVIFQVPEDGNRHYFF